jgi:hypothetical protein
VQNAEFGISHHLMDNQAPKKEHLMKSGIHGNPALSRHFLAGESRFSFKSFISSFNLRRL